MRKLILFTIASLVFATFTHAQEVFIRTYGGYSAGISHSALGVDINGKFDNNNVLIAGSSKGNYGSYGTGGNVGLAVGYMFTEHIGAELSSDVHIGKKQTLSSAFIQDGMGNTNFNEITGYSRRVHLTPALIISGGGERFEPYARLGLVMALAEKLTLRNTLVFNDVTVSLLELEKKNRYSVGFSGAAGLNYRVSDRFALFGEVEFRSLTVAEKELEFTKAVSGGVDVLGNFTESDRKIVFLKELDETSNNAFLNASGFNQNLPSEEIRQFNPANSLNVSLGIRIGFNGSGQPRAR